MAHSEVLASGVFEVPWGDYLSALLNALGVTLKLTVEGFVGACVIGMIVALMRTTKAWPLRSIGYLYTEVLKNLPFVTGIFIVYFGLTGVGIRFGSFTAGVLCLALFYGAYLAEIFRGGLQGIPPGQVEAASALGLGPLRVLTVVRLPQAIRLALPATATMLVDLLKGTAILVTIGGGELMTEAQVITSETFRPLEVYLVVGAIYMAMCWPLSKMASVLEGHLARGTALSPTSRGLRREARKQMQSVSAS